MSADVIQFVPKARKPIIDQYGNELPARRFEAPQIAKALIEGPADTAPCEYSAPDQDSA